MKKSLFRPPFFDLFIFLSLFCVGWTFLLTPTTWPTQRHAVLFAQTAETSSPTPPFENGLPVVAPEVVQMSSESLATIDALIEEAIQDGNTPGAVVAIGRGNQLAFLKAYGNRQTEPTVEPMTTDTLFDLASVTKVIATALSIHLLVDRHQLDLDAFVADYMPEFGTHGKDQITIRQCLTHTSGLLPDNSIHDYLDQTQDEIWKNLCDLELSAQPGEKFMYSDVGFIVLGKLVERVSGLPLDQFAQANLYRPLGMNETLFNPTPELQKKAAATEKRYPDDALWIKGQVHDPRSFAMNAVAGHAGLFSTAPDLALLAAALLGQGTLEGTPKFSPTFLPPPDAANVADESTQKAAILLEENSDRGDHCNACAVTIFSKKTFAAMTEPIVVTSGIRSAGWDKRSAYSGNRGALMSPAAFGHGGFTGTSFWVDPGYNLFVIVLSSRLHPDGQGDMNTLCGKIGSVAVDSIQDANLLTESELQQIHNKIHTQLAKFPTETAPLPTDSVQNPTLDGQTLNGIDVLVRDHFSLLKGRKVGLITNQTGITRDQTPNYLAMHEAGVELVAIFSPEHGLFGTQDQAVVDDICEPQTQLPVYSLYGDTKQPTSAMLEGIDTLVFDIQDIGARFYTFISTMGLAMQAAADRDIDFIVLDRINPIGGLQTNGPVLDPGSEAFVAFCPIPVQHGMTIGELALMFNEEQRLNLDLTVVPVENWTRDQYWDETGLPWVNPSPNMKTLTAEILYPGLCLPEFTNLSMGRGTQTPFEMFGAPWIRAEELAQKMNAYQLPGVQFEPVSFTPPVRQFANEEIPGLRLILTDRDSFDALKMGVTLLTQLKKDYPDQWERARLKTLLLHKKTLQAIEDEKTVDEIQTLWQPALGQFIERRAHYLIYPQRP